MTMEKISITTAVRWNFAVGGAIVAALGLLLIILCVADSFRSPLAGFAGLAFLASGAVVAFLGARELLRARRGRAKERRRPGD
jgi:hypothetical protein